MYSYQQELKLRAEIVFRVGWEDSAPNWNFSKLLELSETRLARKVIFGLHVDIEKANSRRYGVTP